MMRWLPVYVERCPASSGKSCERTRPCPLEGSATTEPRIRCTQAVLSCEDPVIVSAASPAPRRIARTCSPEGVRLCSPRGVSDRRPVGLGGLLFSVSRTCSNGGGS